MNEEKSFFEQIKERLKRYVRWYIYPLIYFTVSGIVCLYAWYRPYPKEVVKAIFNTIVLIPTLLGVGIITVWIVVIIILSITSYYLKQRAPDSFIWRVFQKISVLIHDTEEKPAQKTYSLRRRIVNSLLYSFGTVLIVSGILLLVWIARPYFSLLLSSSKIEALERKVALGQVQGNRIIIPSVLIDAPIIEGINKGKLSRGVCHIPSSPDPGNGGNFIIEGHNLAEFGLWKPQSFFSILEVVEKGAPVYIFYNGGKYIYKVKEKTYRYVTDPLLYDMTPGERLTLISCVSTWSPRLYTTKRTVIIAYPEF